MARALWVEDQAETKLMNYAYPAFLAGYQLDVVDNVSDAVSKVEQDTYDAVVIDLIITAGRDKAWTELDRRNPYNDKNSYLGLQLVRALFAKNFGGPRLSEATRWLSPRKVGIFTVVEDGEVHREIKQYGVGNVVLKRTSDYTALKKLLDILTSAKA